MNAEIEADRTGSRVVSDMETPGGGA